MKATFLLLALSSLSYTFGTSAEGVFPVLTRQNSSPIGTAFLIDREYGWLLTACHVVAAARPAPEDQTITIRWAYKGPFESTRVKHIQLKVLACGYDYFDLAQSDKHKSTDKDWALLKVMDANQLKLFHLFNEFCIPRDLNGEELGKIDRIFVYPFQRGDIQLRPEYGLLSPLESSKLWNVSVSAVGGNSGAPVAPERGKYPLLIVSTNQKHQGGSQPAIGMLLKQVTSTGRHSEMLPAFAFLEECAAKLTPTERVSDIISGLRKEHKEQDWDISLHLLLKELNAIEHWQVIQYLCSSSDIRRKELSQFIISYYGKFRTAFDKLFSCKPDLLAAVFNSTDEILAVWKQEGPSAVSNEVVEAIAELSDWIVEKPTVISHANRRSASKFLTADIYMSSQKGIAPPEKLATVLHLAMTLQRDNPNIPIVAPLALKELDAVEKAALIAARMDRTPNATPEARHFSISSKDFSEYAKSVDVDYEVLSPTNRTSDPRPPYHVTSLLAAVGVAERLGPTALSRDANEALDKVELMAREAFEEANRRRKAN